MNGAEIRLLFKMFPDKTLTCTGEKCVSRNLAKQRVIVFVCANMARTEKWQLLVLDNTKTLDVLKTLNIYLWNIKTINPQGWLLRY